MAARKKAPAKKKAKAKVKVEVEVEVEVEAPAYLSTRIEPDLRDAFIEACKANDSSASREIRHFARDYIKRYGQTKLL